MKKHARIRARKKTGGGKGATQEQDGGEEGKEEAVQTPGTPNRHNKTEAGASTENKKVTGTNAREEKQKQSERKQNSTGRRTIQNRETGT